MKLLPRLVKVKLPDINSRYTNTLDEIHGNLGAFYLLGDIEISWTYNNFIEKTIVKENDLGVFDSGFYKNRTICFNKGNNSNYKISYNSFQNGCTYRPLTESASFICIYYDSEMLKKLTEETALNIYDYHIITEPKQIDVNENDYLLVLTGKPLINGKEKTFKSWINFSKTQTIDIDSPNEQSVIILFK